MRYWFRKPDRTGGSVRIIQAGSGFRNQTSRCRRVSASSEGSWAARSGTATSPSRSHGLPLSKSVCHICSLTLIVDRSRVGPSGRRNPQVRKLCKPRASRRTRRTTWIRRRRPQGPHIDRRRIAYDPVRHRRTRVGFDPMQHRPPTRTAATPAKTSSTRRRLGTPPRRHPASRLGRLRSPTVSAVFTAAPIALDEVFGRHSSQCCTSSSFSEPGPGE